MPTEASLTPPTADRYVTAFSAISNLTDLHLQMLRIHYQAPERTVTAKGLAALVGESSYQVVNSQYGRLARLVGEQIGYTPQPQQLGTLVRFEQRNKEWHWLMRPEVAEALERLGWVEAAAPLLPEEVASTASLLVEGAVSRVSVNANECNPEARRRCLEAYGTRCYICGFSFGAVYGEVAKGYMHVHHLRPLSEINGEYVVDPITDLRPICPNCHAVVHLRMPAFAIEEVRAFLHSRSQT